MPFVCLYACLSVYLLAAVRKNYWTDLHENFITDVSVHKEELIKFRSHPSPDPDSGIFLKDSSTFQDSAFFNNLAHTYGENDRIFITLSQIYLWTRKSPLNFGRNRDLESGSGVSWTAQWRTDSGSRPYSPWRTYAVSNRSCWICGWCTS